MADPILAEVTITEWTEGIWCPHCQLSTAVEIRTVATRRDRPDLPPVGRGRTLECDRCERELIEPEVTFDPGDENPALFIVVDG